MKQTEIQLRDGKAVGYEESVGPVNLVFAKSDRGLIACGLVDVALMDKFSFPAVKLKATGKPLISTVDDLLAATVREANETAKKAGVTDGMTGRGILELLQSRQTKGCDD